MEYSVVTNGVLQEINLVLLQPSPLNTFDASEYHDLMCSIELYGLLTPLSVIGPDKEGIYTILAGERRYNAISKLKEQGKYPNQLIPCYILGPDTMDEKEQKLIIESSNLETRDDIDRHAHRFQIIQILSDMAKSGDIKHHEIANIAGQYMKMSTRYRRMYLQIFENAEDSVRKMVEDNQIKVASAAKIASLPREYQENAANEIKNGFPEKEIIKKYTLEDPGDLEDPALCDNPEISDVFGICDTEDNSDEDIHRVGLFNPGFSRSETFDTYNGCENDYEGYDNDYVKEVDDYSLEGNNLLGDFEEQPVREDYGEDIEKELENFNFDKYDQRFGGLSMVVDTHGEVKKLVESDPDSEKLIKKQRINSVIEWCKKMLANDENYECSEEERQVVELCSQVAERFS